MTDAAAGEVTLGVEIAQGATRLTVGRPRGAEVRRWLTRLPTPPAPDDALDAINSLIERALAESGPLQGRMARLGVAVWGTVDAEHGAIRALPQASHWENFPLAARLAERWGPGVHVESATNASALAEAELGAGRNASPLLYVLLARNVTAALVVNNTVIHGAHGMEGALGHWLVRQDGPRCACGVSGHLDPLVSAQSLVRNMIGRASDSDESTAAMLRATGGRAEAMTAAQVMRLAAEGEPAARAVADDALDGLSVALANLVALLDPAAIVIGGPVRGGGRGFLRAVAGAARRTVQPVRRDAAGGAGDPGAACRTGGRAAAGRAPWCTWSKRRRSCVMASVARPWHNC